MTPFYPLLNASRCEGLVDISPVSRLHHPLHRFYTLYYVLASYPKAGNVRNRVFTTCIEMLTQKKKKRHKIIYQHLSRDHHPEIAFVAMRTVAVIERTFLNLLSESDAEEGKDLPVARSRRPRQWKCLQRPLGRMILLPCATKLVYAMTLGRTGGLSR
jgi:hypothetical protein